MEIIGTIIIGFIVGMVARFFKPGNDKMGLILTTFIGILGAFAGTYLGQAFGIYEAYESAGFIGAVVGAIIVLSMLKALSNRK